MGFSSKKKKKNSYFNNGLYIEYIDNQFLNVLKLIEKVEYM